jgi:hypothetical protein
MVSIANVNYSDNFDTWLTRSNQAFHELRILTGIEPLHVANSIVATDVTGYTVSANALNVTVSSLFAGHSNFGNTTLITFPAIANLKIPGGANGQVLTTDGSGTISWAASAGGGGAHLPSFANVSGVIANTQFPGALSISSNTTFSGANATFGGSHVNLGAVGDVSISGGTTGYPLKTDGSGTLSWGTLGNTAIAAGAVGNTEIATAAVTNTHIKAAAVDSAALAAGAVTFQKLPKNLVVTTTAGSNNVMLSPGDLVLANTRGGSHYVALNATPTNGDEIRFYDSGGCWVGNNLIVNSNSKTVMGVANFTGNVSNGYFTLVYSSTINDWKVINYG